MVSHLDIYVRFKTILDKCLLEGEFAFMFLEKIIFCSNLHNRI